MTGRHLDLLKESRPSLALSRDVGPAQPPKPHWVGVVLVGGGCKSASTWRRGARFMDRERKAASERTQPMREAWGELHEAYITVGVGVPLEAGERMCL